MYASYAVSELARGGFYFERTALRAELAGMEDGGCGGVRPQVGRNIQILETATLGIIDTSGLGTETAGVGARGKPVLRCHQHGGVVVCHQVGEVLVVGDVPSVGADALHLRWHAAGEFGGGIVVVEVSVGGQVGAGILPVGHLATALCRRVVRGAHVGNRPAVAARTNCSVHVAVSVGRGHRSAARRIKDGHNLREFKESTAFVDDLPSDGVGTAVCAEAVVKRTIRVLHRQSHIGHIVRETVVEVDQSVAATVQEHDRRVGASEFHVSGRIDGGPDSDVLCVGCAVVAQVCQCPLAVDDAVPRIVAGGVKVDPYCLNACRAIVGFVGHVARDGDVGIDDAIYLTTECGVGGCREGGCFDVFHLERRSLGDDAVEVVGHGYGY